MFGKKTTQASLLVERALKSSTNAAHAHALRAGQKRSSQRGGTWHQCLIKGDAGFRLSGIIIDYSQTGVRFRYRGRITLPDRLNISVPALNIKSRCEIVWQEKGDAGLKFV